MKLLTLSFLLASALAAPTATISPSNVTYTGFTRNNVELFLGIRYAQDTSGLNRFKPPKPFVPSPGTSVNATVPGLPCPQQLGTWFVPLALNNITEISEDCLNLNIARPNFNESEWESIREEGGLPVMLWIHGGSFWVGSNMEPTHRPDGLVGQSVEGGVPIIHVAINYRLGVFGFSQSGALKEEGSENAGLRDQRFAIEWVRDNIKYWGGNGERITIFGQSSGGLAVGLQVLAYGGTKPLPYQQGIAESQCLEPGIAPYLPPSTNSSNSNSTSERGHTYTRDAFAAVVQYVNCNSTDVDSPEVVSCLRSKDTQTILDAALKTYNSDIAHNIGDLWLPSVDGDFLPDAPSTLLAEGRFGNATYMMGWAEDDLSIFTDTSIATDSDVYNFISNYLPGLSSGMVKDLLSLYDVSEFTPPAGTPLTAQFYRASRIFRDILMTCEPILMAESLNRHGNNVYLYNWNQTILDPILTQLTNISGFGVVHTSEFAYIYGNLSVYNVTGFPFDPTPEDYVLETRASRTWAEFATKGLVGDEGLDGWKQAFWKSEDEASPATPEYPYLYTVGGGNPGLSALDGEGSMESIRKQRLVERCGWINTPEIITRIGF